MFHLKTCKICGGKFIPKTYRHVFCTRKCFKIHYKNEMKIDNYPSYICQKCGVIIKLDFHPKSSFIKWKKFKCKSCDFMPMAEFEKEKKDLNIFL